MRESSQEDALGQGASAPLSRAQQLQLFTPEEIVRPDQNIGKYATMLFASPHLKNLDDHRVFSWPVMVEGDEEVMASIAIHPQKDQIIPTTTTFKVLMALIQVWRMRGSDPSGSISFSDRQLAEVAGWSFSGATAKRIRTHVRILQGTTIDWVLSYRRGEKLERRVQAMSLINDATTVERSEMFEDERFRAVQNVTLHRMLVENMLSNRVRPINFASLRQIKSDASTRLYMMLDLFLARKPKWERRSYDLLTADLGYEGKRYGNRGERKRTLAKLIADLDGKELASGKLSVEMAETADGKDWKIVARKERRIVKKRPRVSVICSTSDAELLADDLLAGFEGLEKAGPPKRGFMVFLCERYPEHVLRDALARAKADYRGHVRKTVGAVFRYELESLVRGRGDLTWYKASPKHG